MSTYPEESEIVCGMLPAPTRIMVLNDKFNHDSYIREYMKQHEFACALREIYVKEFMACHVDNILDGGAETVDELARYLYGLSVHLARLYLLPEASDILDFLKEEMRNGYWAPIRFWFGTLIKTE